jgi:hypothetical protein
MDDSGNIKLDVSGISENYMSLVDLIKSYNSLITTISVMQDLRDDQYIKYWIHIYVEVTDNATSGAPKVSS